MSNGRAPGMRRSALRCAPTEASKTTRPGALSRCSSQSASTNGPGSGPIGIGVLTVDAPRSCSSQNGRGEDDAGFRRGSPCGCRFARPNRGHRMRPITGRPPPELPHHPDAGQPGPLLDSLASLCMAGQAETFPRLGLSARPMVRGLSAPITMPPISPTFTACGLSDRRGPGAVQSRDRRRLSEALMCAASLPPTQPDADPGRRLSRGS